MTPEQIKAVQQSFEQVEPIAETAAGIFYDRLFTLDPDLKGLFNTDMEKQGRKLMAMIGAAVRGLDHIEELVPVVEDLGRRHVRYGVNNADYDTVGEALIWTLDTGLGDDFTPEVQEAWVAAYTLLANTMKAAAAKAA